LALGRESQNCDGSNKLAKKCGTEVVVCHEPILTSLNQNPSCSTMTPGKIANATVTGKIKKTKGTSIELGYFPLRGRLGCT
jgi:hypothetical protein